MIESHSTARVLTSEFVAGRRFADVLALDDATRSRYGEIIYRFVFGSILRFGMFNGDPHPGNYLFDDQGRVVFIDFGCVKYFPLTMLDNWRALVTAHLQADQGEFRRKLVELGFIKDESPLDAAGLYDYFGYFYEPFHQNREFRFTREYNAQSFRMISRPRGASPASRSG